MFDGLKNEMQQKKYYIESFRNFEGVHMLVRAYTANRTPGQDFFFFSSVSEIQIRVTCLHL